MHEYAPQCRRQRLRTSCDEARDDPRQHITGPAGSEADRASVIAPEIAGRIANECRCALERHNTAQSRGHLPGGLFWISLDGVLATVEQRCHFARMRREDNAPLMFTYQILERQDLGERGGVHHNTALRLRQQMLHEALADLGVHQPWPYENAIGMLGRFRYPLARAR